MFIESVQYSLGKVRELVKNYSDEQKVLPVTTAKNKVKCLDFDMDTVVFRSVPKSPVKSSEINPYNKTWLEVMEMV
jgi:hypothetical protein